MKLVDFQLDAPEHWQIFV